MRRLAPAAAAIGVLTGALWSDAASARFRPVEDRRYVYDIDETRVDDGVTRCFHARRRVVFHGTATGFDAVVTLEAARHSPASEVGAMFQAATAALLLRPLRFRLDAAGRVTAVDDADAAVALIADAIERFGTERRDRPARLGHAQALAAPLRDANPARKTAMLASILQPIVLPDEGERAAGSRSVVLPERSPLSAGARLNGTETVTRDAAANVTLTLLATGTVAEALPQNAPGATSLPQAGAAITIRQTRTIDVASGLLRDSVETRDTTLPGGSTRRHTTVETVVHVTLATS